MVEVITRCSNINTNFKVDGWIKFIAQMMGEKFIKIASGVPPLSPVNKFNVYFVY